MVSLVCLTIVVNITRQNFYIRSYNITVSYVNFGKNLIFFTVTYSYLQDLYKLTRISEILDHSLFL
jgi:hypothetical protein